MAQTTDVTIKFENMPAIRGLIEALTEVAANAVPVVEGWDQDVSETAYESRMGALRDSILALNDYVDEHVKDD